MTDTNEWRVVRSKNDLITAESSPHCRYHGAPDAYPCMMRMEYRHNLNGPDEYHREFLTEDDLVELLSRLRDQT